MRIVVVAGLLVLIGLIATIVLARVRWRAATEELTARLDRAGAPATPSAILPQEIDNLPAPVARYMRAALGARPRAIATARVRWRGDFLARPGPDGWRPFQANQVFQTRPAGFVWDARVRMAPGLDVFVRDAFADGAGSMRGAILGLIPVVDVSGTPEIAAGALQRYLAEAVWFPTALLPRHGVRWTALDDSSARATLTVGSISVSCDFRFGADGLVESVYSPSRFRDVNGSAVPTPWEGRLARHVERAGVRVPAAGEVAWILPEGRMPYWRGELVDLVHIFEEE
ncbi:MAG: hypothetical protein FJY75_08840 [Candidatus Eisenbacteria bacterium]|uniref:Uncharacterized protein n=1 Tax=Eiseniibacteriota bacterium TaxID=2212470 RepID=A0A937X8P5_UNCEI|nr:hypothetical protein [Candidatus Eisenbacteria bacterium]